jgi:DNA-binding GntR family transcriptional regulator
MHGEAQGYGFLKNRGNVEPRGATNRVAEALREAIVSMDLRPGETLDKAAICARLGVSRFPVSEALTRLEAEGLVDIQPQRGTSVALIRLADTRENLFLRKALETEVVRSLAGQLDAATLAELKRNLRYQKSAAGADDRSGFHALDLEFHDLLLEAVRFPRVKAAAESARLRLDRVRRLLASPRRVAVTFKEHVRIISALEAGDPEEAAEAMAAHLDSVMQELQAFARARPEHFADQAGGAETAAPPKRKRQSVG